MGVGSLFYGDDGAGKSVVWSSAFFCLETVLRYFLKSFLIFEEKEKGLSL